MKSQLSAASALALLLALACSRPAPVPVAVPPAPEPVAEPAAEVLWDAWGIPHIYGRDVAAAVRAFGWAQMRSHGDLLLRLYGQARGRAAEYWGERYYESDVWVWTNGVPDRAERWLEQQYPEERHLLEAFVAGINAFGEAHPDSLTGEAQRVLPVRPVDVLAHLQRVLHFTFLASREDVAAAVGAWTAAGGARVDAASPRALTGSNAWAIAPARSASGRALLLANPHLPWNDVYTWFESQLAAPGLAVYGVALVGLPLPGIAFNDSLGWTHTVNPIDAGDLYQLELRGEGYVLDGAYRPFEVEERPLQVRDADGDLHTRPLRIRRSVHGPVVADDPRHALALRVAGLDAPHLLGQHLDMARAGNIRQFEAALGRLQLPLFNTIYADARGHILSVYNGRVPKRPLGDRAFWAGVVPGNTAATLWTDTYTYGQLPRVADPASGWLQNANDPPWTATLPLPLDPVRFDPTMAPPPSLGFRAQRSIRMLAEDSLIGFDELVAYKHSTRLELADHILEDVVHAGRSYGGPTARAAADVLERWDRQTLATSRGAVLFQAFAARLLRHAGGSGSPFDVPWTLRAPLATPDGLADARAAAVLLEGAAADVVARYGTLDVAWGDVYRLRRDSLDLPASGGPGALGAFRVLDFRPAAPNRFVAAGGDTWVAAVEFGSPLRARALLGYGNASRPGSPHRTDQLPLMAAQRLRDVWLTRADVEANLRDRELIE